MKINGNQKTVKIEELLLIKIYVILTYMHKIQQQHAHVSSSTVHNSQAIKSAQVPINQRVDKESVVYTQSGLLFSHEQECMSFAGK